MKDYEYNGRTTDYSGNTLTELNHKFKIFADLGKFCICPICGAPDCGDEFILWSQIENQKYAIVLGGGTFGSFLSFWDETDNYKELPKFIREHNEGIGWDDSSNVDFEIEVNDFLSTLEFIKNSKYSKIEGCDFLTNYYPVLKSFCDMIVQHDSKIFVIK